MKFLRKFPCLWLLGLSLTVALLAALGLWRGWGRCPLQRRARFAAGLAVGWPVALGGIVRIIVKQ